MVKVTTSHCQRLRQNRPPNIACSELPAIPNYPPLSYYACNSEQLKVKDMYLYEEDPGKKKAAAQAHYDAYREERKTSTSSLL